LKILLEKPFRPRPVAERFAVGKPDRLSPSAPKNGLAAPKNKLETSRKVNRET
jgi:hypothetical protein